MKRLFNPNQGKRRKWRWIKTAASGRAVRRVAQPLGVAWAGREGGDGRMPIIMRDRPIISDGLNYSWAVGNRGQRQYETNQKENNLKEREMRGEALFKRNIPNDVMQQ